MLCNRTILAFCLALSLSHCGTNPVTGKREIQFVSQSEEINIGEKNYLPSQQSQGGQYIIDADLTNYINEVGQKIARVSDRPDLPYEFVVLNNSVPNAWALPGGKIAFNRGLLVELKSEAELAAVLAHEIVHAAARHGAQGMERGMLLNAGIMGLGIAAGDEENAQLIVGAAALGSQLISQKYGRDAESEADKYGMKYMAKAGYDPYAAVELQKTFVRLSKGRQSNWLEGLFASHPPSQDRVKANEETARKLNAKGALNEKQYQAKISHLIKTQPAYEKYEKAAEALKKKDSINSLKLIDEALKIEPREGYFHALKGDVYYKQNDFTKAEQYYSDAVNANPKLFLFYLERGLAKLKLNKPDSARQDFEKSIKLLPTAPAYNALGNIALQNNDKKNAKEYFKEAAGSHSREGKQALAAYTKLDMPSNPNKYFAFDSLQSPGNKLGLKLTNQSTIAVSDIKGSIEIHDGKGTLLLRQPISYGKIIEPGKSITLDTGLPIANLDNKTKLKAIVTSAAPANSH